MTKLAYGYIEGVERIEAAPKEGAELSVRCAADIEPENIEWLWPGRLARGKHTALAGDPGTGKSQLSIFTAAAITTGGDWPCGEGKAPLGNVIILSAEDGPADTIVPRCIAARADLERVHIVSSVVDGERRSFNLQKDLALLEHKIDEIGDVAMVIIDPISSYLGRTDSHNNASVRAVLEPASEMAERKRVALLSITHFSKAQQGSTVRALHRFIGSIAFTGAPRAAFAVVPDPDDEGRRLFLSAKNNLAAPPQGLAFRLDPTILPDHDIVASRVAFDTEPVSVNADDAMAVDSDRKDITTTEEAEGLLGVILAEGEMLVDDIEAEARAAGPLGRYQELRQSKPFRTARKHLGVEYRRDGFGGGARYYWFLPCAPSNPMSAPQNNRAHMASEGTHGGSEPARCSAQKDASDEGATIAARDAYEERAAHLEHMDGLDRVRAEAQAASEADMPDIPEWLKRTREGC